MDSKVVHSACSCEVLVEGGTQVFSTSVGAECVNGGTVMLCASPGLEGPVAVQGIPFVREEVDHCEASNIVHESDEELAASTSQDSSGAPDIGVHLSTKVQSLLTDTDLQNGLVEQVCINTGWAVFLKRCWVQGNASHKTFLNQLVSTGGGDVSHALVEFHHGHYLNSMYFFLM